MPSDVAVTTIHTLAHVPPGTLLSFTAANELEARMKCVQLGCERMTIFENSAGWLTCWIEREVKK